MQISTLFTERVLHGPAFYDPKDSRLEQNTQLRGCPWPPAGRIHDDSCPKRRVRRYQDSRENKVIINNRPFRLFVFEMFREVPRRLRTGLKGHFMPTPARNDYTGGSKRRQDKFNIIHDRRSALESSAREISLAHCVIALFVSYLFTPVCRKALQTQPRS